MLKVYIDSGNGPVDYTRYVVGETIAIQRSLAVPSTCSFEMNNFDSVFQLPPLRSYVRIFSTKYNRSLFTGFITVDPQRTFLGLAKGPLSYVNPGTYQQGTAGQLFNYKFALTSDEYLLNIKAVNFIPAFVNRTQGQILQTIAEALCPGFFDYTYIATGQLVPFLAYDPTKSWSEYAKEFCDASRFRYNVVDKAIHFQPYGDGKLGIQYDELGSQGTFDPYALQTSALTTPVVNDVTIIGQQEAGNNHEDYFMGSGFEGAFPLRHQVFNGGGSSSGESGTVVLADDWSETGFDLQTWSVQDPQNNFTFADGELNVLTGVSNSLGASYVQAYNGLELAGGKVIQHGEFTFQGLCSGSYIGGIYDDTTLSPASCEAAFNIEATASVLVTASGTSGLLIRPFRLGALPNKAFQLTTKVNKTYTLTTIISAPAPARYTQIYSSLAGAVFGGQSLQSNIRGTITWKVTEIDQGTGVLNDFTFTLTDQPLPSYAVYGFLNNVFLNLSVGKTTIYAPPLGTLAIATEVGAGLLAPIYISGNVQYTGGFVAPSGGNLPILPPHQGENGTLGPENQFSLGASLQNQNAEIDLGDINSTLNFYSNSLPGVGTRIRLQTWESQAALSRIQNPISISGEAVVVGDDGIRSSIVTNLNPLPRTSEDCDAAAQAYLTDRVGIVYQGTYKASYIFFSQQTAQLTDDIEFFPVCGRYLYVNAPKRGINQTNLLVTSLTVQVTEMAGEVMDFNISFGPDLYLEKVLANFVNPPPNVLLAKDTVVKLTPQQLAQVGALYLPDVTMSNFTTLAISGQFTVLNLVDVIPSGAFYELRSADLNWGVNDNNLLARYTGNQVVTLPRTSFEQVWYLRFVNNRNVSAIKSSRRTKVLRLLWPQVPSTPAFLYADTSTINTDFNGDIRNIEGIELRDDTDKIVYYDGIVGSEFDMQLNLDQLRGTLPAFALTGAIVGGAIGSFMKGVVPPTQRSFNVHFFNLMWEYSPALSVFVPPITGVVIAAGYRFGSALEIKMTTTPNRIDVASTTLQVASDVGFGSIVLTQKYDGLAQTMHAQVPVTGALWVRVLCTDHISDGAWSNTVAIPLGDLIASDYLTGQASTQPVLTNLLGSLFTYSAPVPGSSSTATLTWSWGTFTIAFPNNFMLTVAAGSSSTYTGLTANSTYYFYFGVTVATATVVIVGPSAINTPSAALAAQIAVDGVVPLTSAGLPAVTAQVGGSPGTGGGGGSDTCSIGSTELTLIDGTKKTIFEMKAMVPFAVKTPTGRPGVITAITESLEEVDVYTVLLSSGKSKTCSTSDGLFNGDAWKGPLELIPEVDVLWIDTEKGNAYDKVKAVTYAGKAFVHRVTMNGAHAYPTNDIWAHNYNKL